MSKQGRFPASFYTLAAPYLNMTGSAAETRQFSKICYVFFGHDDAVIIKTGENILSKNLSEPLAKAIENFTSKGVFPAGYTLGKRTTLCPWDGRYFFLEATCGHAESQYSFSLPSPISKEFMAGIVDLNYPPEHLIPEIPVDKPQVKTPAFHSEYPHKCSLLLGNPNFCIYSGARGYTRDPFIHTGDL
jgi:hypothetical protein